RRLFGNVGLKQEESREIWIARYWSDLAQDLRYALRGFRRSWTFTVVIVLSLALGIGPNTAIFSITNALLFDTLRAREPARLLRVNIGAGDCSYPNYKDFRARATLFEGLLAYRSSPGVLQIDTELTPITMELVTDNYFAVLGVRLALGK